MIEPTTEPKSDNDRIEEGSELELETIDKRYWIKISNIESKPTY